MSELTCKCASNSQNYPGQEGEEGGSPQVQPQCTHKVRGHPIQQDEVRPMVDKIRCYNGPGCSLGQKQLPGAQHACNKSLQTDEQSVSSLKRQWQVIRRCQAILINFVVTLHQ